MPTSLARFAPWLGGRAARLAGRDDAAAAEPLVVSFDTASDARLAPCGIGPESIVSGSPQARASNEASSPDGRLTTGMWDCTAGVLDIHFGCDELVHILDGEVTVRNAGRVHVLTPGSVAYFPRGAVARWEIGRYVKKVYVHRSVPRSFGRRVVGKLRRMAGLAG